MAGTFTVNGDGTITVSFEYTAEQGLIFNTVNDAVAQLYKIGGFDIPIPFEELTNQQKLDILDGFVKRSVLNKARRFNEDNAIDEAIIIANEDAAAKYF